MASIQLKLKTATQLLEKAEARLHTAQWKNLPVFYEMELQCEIEMYQNIISIYEKLLNPTSL